MVVSRSSATVAIDTFITELSSIIRNCPAHSVSRTIPAPFFARSTAPSLMLVTLSIRPVASAPMGLGDFFSKRRERENAIPQTTVETGDPVAPGQSAVTPLQTASTQAAAGAGHAPVNAPGMVQLQQLQALMAQHSVDLSSQPMEVRQAVVADLNAGGVPAKLGEGMQVTDPAQIHTVVNVLIKHGLLPVGTTVDTE